MMVFRVTKHVFIHMGVLFLSVLSLFSSSGAHFRTWLFFAAIHEGCHAMATSFLSVPLLRLTVLPYGFSLRIGETTFYKAVLIYLAGPLSSLLLFFILREKDCREINLFLFLINLIPALPLDGGRLLHHFLWKTVGTYNGNRYMCKLGILISALCLIASIWFSSLAAGYVAYIVFTNRNKTPTFPFLRRKCATAQPIKVFHVSSHDRVLPLTHRYSPYYKSVFYLVDMDVFVPEDAATACLRQNAAAILEDALFFLE